MKKMTLKKQFTLRLLELLDGRTAAWLARELGITTPATYKWVTGTAIPSMDRWPDLARVFGLKSYHDLLP